MPQIYMIANGKGRVLKNYFPMLISVLIAAVEKGFGLERLKDVAFTALQYAEWTEGEKDVQIEIRYTAGEDEYNRGKPFDPSLKEQKFTAELIHEAFLKFLGEKEIPRLSLSVWCKPHYNSVFMAWD